jgi:hypothetical protein
VRYAFPPDYQYQVPLLLEIFNDTNANIIHYKIEDDEFTPNKILNFTLEPMIKNEERLIHFTVWVLVEHNDFSDLPWLKTFPKESDLPEETKKWLQSTEVVQKDNILIKTRARLLRGLNLNMIRYAKKISSFIKDHRYFLFILQIKLGLLLNQDAITTLLINGENVGRSHLACALLRAQNIPSRVILALNDQGFWTQMHYMAEYYVPDYGWVLLETTRAKTPFNTSRQVINRICYPENENDTKKDYIFQFMKGEEKWIWIDNEENVQPYYVDCETGSKSQMFKENITVTCSLVSDDTFELSRTVFGYYQEFLGQSLSPENKPYFQRALDNQTKAIYKLKMGDDPLRLYKFITLMDGARQEYERITL